MDDAARVRELDREADVDERAQQRAAAARALARAASASVVPASRFIVKYGRPVVVAAELVDRHDRRVIEPRLDPRLAQEPRDRARASASRCACRLIATSRPIRWSCARDHLAHAAAADQLAELVAGRRPASAHPRHWARSPRPWGRPSSLHLTCDGVT